ncbi:MAG: phosphoribosylamine--glycine ligase [Rikenellaceae bacterium]
MEKVLVIGSGGREHAIVDALKRSDEVSKVYCAPGNAGIAKIAECLPIAETDVEALCKFAYDKDLSLTVVGPEVALAAGVVDRFKKAGLRIFGPTQAAAQIESSKEFAKELMKKYDIPTAAFETFEDYDAAVEYVRKGSLPAVLKYDGLAAGKGVVIAETIEEAEAALKEMLLDDKFGKGKVVIEDFLEGPEFSFMCFADGENLYPMALSQDHKRAYDGDKGPNTGGMGAYSPVPMITAEDEAYAMEKIMLPTAKAMIAEGARFTGVLYGGLIKTANGIKVIEFNARFGDPETEVVLPRLKSDIYEIFCNVADGKKAKVEWHDFATLGVVLASKGYPAEYEKGIVIKGLEKISSTAKLYHMGTAKNERGEIVTNGGRVLFVVGKGATLEEAQKNANEEVAKIECEGLFSRTDIGHKAIK